MRLDQTGQLAHSGSEEGEARHSTLGQHAARTRRNASVAHAKGRRTCARWPNNFATNRQPEGADSGTRPPPQLHKTPHQGRRQRDRREEHKVTEAAHKKQHRRPPANKTKAHLDGPQEARSPQAHREPTEATSTNWRQPASRTSKGLESLIRASKQTKTDGSQLQTLERVEFASQVCNFQQQ